MPRVKTLAAISLVLAGDYLFFDQRAGMNVAVFLTLLVVAVSLTSYWSHHGRKILFSSLLFAGFAVFALAENISWLSVGLAIAGISTIAVHLKSPWYFDVTSWARDVLRFVFTAPARVFKDARLFRKLRTRSGASLIPGGIVSWIVPISMTTIFAWFFSLANPLMAAFFSSLFMTVPDTDVIPAGRLFLWFGLGLIIWPFFSRHMLKKHGDNVVPAFTDNRSYTLRDRLLSPRSIVRSLIMFNILFGFQTAFDFTYLWAGAELPANMTYASYAHRGAYPLTVTVLLAAAFVLVTMYKGSKSEHNPLIRNLVYLWIGQNVLLTLSSIDRLWLYVSAYSLTYLRVAAFIWMGLVAIGRVLILIRLWRNYSNKWLLNSNMVNLVGTLFVCAFINFGSQISLFNVQQQRPLDLRYLQSIGPSALPAIRWLQADRKSKNLEQLLALDQMSNRFEADIQILSNRNWRELTWRDRRLISWLANEQATVQKKFTPSTPQDRP